MNVLLGFIQSSQLLQFTYLQALDLLSTVAFLAHGVGEANPLVRWSMSMTSNPIGGLLLVKAMGIGFAMYCVQSQRERLLGRINIFYAGLVVWNLICLVMSSID